jgi:hypothetical protein
MPDNSGYVDCEPEEKFCDTLNDNPRGPAVPFFRIKSRKDQNEPSAATVHPISSCVSESGGSGGSVESNNTTAEVACRQGRLPRTGTTQLRRVYGSGSGRGSRFGGIGIGLLFE